ncbi:MAG: hypothetical protein ACLPG5_08115, partial [Acidocella sp.]
GLPPPPPWLAQMEKHKLFIYKLLAVVNAPKTFEKLSFIARTSEKIPKITSRQRQFPLLR